MKLAGVAILLSALLSISCGNFNFNKIFLSEDQTKSLDILIHKAQAEYDAGDFENAKKFAEKAYVINPASEEVSILLGYIHLAMAGIDTFQLANGLLETSKSSSTGTSTALLAPTINASSFLNKLKIIIGLKEETSLALGELQFATVDPDEYPLFKDYDVLLPYTVTDVRQRDIPMINNIDKAVRYVCPFVDEEVKLPDEDSRHSADECVPSINPRHFTAKAHFLFAFSHLAEALAFYTAVLYQEADKEKPNLELRIDSLNAAQSENEIGLVGYTNHVKNLAETVGEIIPVDDVDSQFRGILNGFRVASLTFARMAGLPPKFTKGINNSIASIEQKREQISTGTAEEKDGKSLKSQFTSSMTSSLATQIETLSTENPEEFEDNKEELCGAYDSLSGGVGTAPTACE